MLSNPSGEGAPATASEGMREMAEWFDLYDNHIIPLVNDIIQASEIPADLKERWAEYAHNPGSGVQNDLRRWADELEGFGGR